MGRQATARIRLFLAAERLLGVAFGVILNVGGFGMTLGLEAWMRKAGPVLTFLAAVALFLAAAPPAATSPPQDAQDPQVLFKSCMRGDAGACRNLAYMLNSQCDANFSVACFALGFLHEYGLGVPKDYERALELYEEACTAGVAFSCTGSAGMYEAGKGVPRDKEHADQLLQQACAGGHKSACGYVHEHGLGVRQDPARAVNFYRSACDAGEMDGCVGLGHLYETGVGVRMDGARAASLYQRACEEDNVFACGELGYLYQQGTGVVPDAFRAQQLLRTACRMGAGDLCYDIGDAYENERFGRERDLDRALAFYRSGCDAGSSNACRGAQRLNAPPPRVSRPAPPVQAAPPAETPADPSNPGRLSLENVLKLLDAGVTPARVKAVIAERGVGFQLDEETEKRLRAAGATDEVILQIARSFRRAPR
jgi:TPR repeat protein